MISFASSKKHRGALMLISFCCFSYFIGSLLYDREFKYAENTDKSCQWNIRHSGRMQRPIHDVTISLNEGTDSGPRLRQATMIYGTGTSVYEGCVDTHVKHGEHWDVPTHVLRHDIVDSGYFNKPAFLLGLIINERTKPYGKRAEWIVWFDADSIILNKAVPWTLFLPPPEFKDIHLLATKDMNGFNAGMFLVRVDEWSVKMLSEVMALRQLQPDLPLPFEDQAAIDWVCSRPGYEEHVIYQPHNWWNGFGIQGHPFPTDRFILHFAGVDAAEGTEPKATVMDRWVDRLQNNASDWEIPLENLTIKAEVSEYWTTLIKAQNMERKAEAWAVERGGAKQDIGTARSELKQAIMKDADNSTRIVSGTERLENLMKDVSVGDTTRDSGSHKQDRAS